MAQVFVEWPIPIDNRWRNWTISYGHVPTSQRHIGEVQTSVWPQEVRDTYENIL